VVGLTDDGVARLAEAAPVHLSRARMTVEALSPKTIGPIASRPKADDWEAICVLDTGIQRTLEAIVMPDDLAAAAITRSLARLGNQAAHAVRSSAPAEDLPTACSRASRTRI
jgi:phosphoenolpyruvate synthase/pyruvate phosphate dikinase